MHAGRRLLFRALPVLLAQALASTQVAAQAAVDVPGVVLDVANRAGIPDVILRVLGTDVSAASDGEGRFVLRGLPGGVWTLRVDHIGYGTHEHEIAVAVGQSVQLEIRLAAEAIELEELVVETLSRRQEAERAQGFSLHVVGRPEIERALGTSRHLGDLIRQTVPGIRLRQGNNLAGTDVCLEFRAAATISLLQTQACNHPMVVVDGVPVSNPNYLYGTIGLDNLERIQMIPPGEAGARYGSGSLYGVLLIDTRTPGLGPRPGPAYDPASRRRTFDWDRDPVGHPGLRTVGSAFVGNAAGLALGIAVGRRCFGVDARDQIVARCGTAGDGAAVIAAMALPALGSAIGARIGGGTDLSVGRFIPALVGAGMMIFPGYAFSMSTVGGGASVANVVGATMLVVGTPLLVTLADRMFRELR